MIKVKGYDAVVFKLKKEMQIYTKEKSKPFLEGVIDKLADATPVDTGRARKGWELNVDGDIVNKVPYISELNEGHSKQAPARFVESVLISIPQIRPNGVIVLEVEDE